MTNSDGEEKEKDKKDFDVYDSKSFEEKLRLLGELFVERVENDKETEVEKVEAILKVLEVLENNLAGDSSGQAQDNSKGNGEKD